MNATETMSKVSLKIAGNLRNFQENWTKITSDPIILNHIRGYKLEFVKDTPPFQFFRPRPLEFSLKEQEVIKNELMKFLDKGVIEIVSHSPGQYVSNIFLRPKREEGSYRVILNLKSLNRFIQYHHFKMDVFESVLPLISAGCFMQSVDIKDAYYCVPVARADRKFLRFSYDGVLYQFTCIPNGLASGPRIYTKICKPVFATLRKMGVSITGYIDDSLIVSDTKSEAKEAGEKTTKLLQDLGFIINWEKTVLEAAHQREYLGFVIDSERMVVLLPERKQESLRSMCSSMVGSNRVQIIRTVATLIGLMVAALPAVDYGQLHYRALERDKIEALKLNRGDYDGVMSLSDDALMDVQWWIENIDQAKRQISRGKPSYVLTSDASFGGWGGYLKGKRAGGRWTQEEVQTAGQSINYLELLAGFFVLRSFRHRIGGQHVRLRMDNTTAIAYINHMGGVKSHKCNELVKELWQWCQDNDIWVSAAHIPGHENVEADYESRNFDDDKEWMLNRNIFARVVDDLGEVEIDLFASRLNKRLPTYVSWRPDPFALYVDAFSGSWKNAKCYLFPPFSLIGRCLRKITDDETEATVIVPLWTTRNWFPMLLKMLVKPPIVLPRVRNLLTLPPYGKPHPLIHRMTLVACRLSGLRSRSLEFRRELPRLSQPPGSHLLSHNMERILRDGRSFVTEGVVIQFKQM